MVGEARAAEVGLAQAVPLDQRAHGAVEDQDPLRCRRVEERSPALAGEWLHHPSVARPRGSVAIEVEVRGQLRAGFPVGGVLLAHAARLP